MANARSRDFFWCIENVRETCGSVSIGYDTREKAEAGLRREIANLQLKDQLRTGLLTDEPYKNPRIVQGFNQDNAWERYCLGLGEKFTDHSAKTYEEVYG